MSDLIFAAKRSDTYTSGTWIALIVDGDPGIHATTRASPLRHRTGLSHVSAASGSLFEGGVRTTRQNTGAAKFNSILILDHCALWSIPSLATGSAVRH